MAEEKEYEVIDKRRIRTEAEASSDAPTEEAPEPETNAASGGITEEELRAAMEEAAEAAEAAGMGMPELDVPSALRFCVQMLQEIAWMKLGLVASPSSGKIEQDLPQAKVAIDAVGDLATRLNPFAGESERREMQTLLSNLRINFVQKSQQG
jgi:hypothetical protein